MRENTERKEEMFLSPYATRSSQTRGRERAEEKCPMRTDFQRDRDRIIYSKAFRRLKNKTQVFFSPEGDHYRTRLTHTLDVSQVARSIARGLDLNEDLAEAIALGHDLGHTPFGHSGEAVLNRLAPLGFEHNKQSLRVVEVLENNGSGLNLTFEVRDGILNHKKTGNPATLEGQAVSIADRIAYINHDIEDAKSAGLLKDEDLPAETALLGSNSRERINTMITSIWRNSAGKGFVAMEDDVLHATEVLRDFMFKNVYLTPEAKGEEERADMMLTTMYEYFLKKVDALPDIYKKLLDRFSLETVVCDYISSMTDRYAVYVFESLFIPKNFLISRE
ncbi:MAG: deoxyguanosinetriphosphate triphosphohydrolase [Clostridia bacterium]|nr:deoxyguanosinetriphosphate triphosphohydrolase [Clostridia bacterium]